MIEIIECKEVNKGAIKANLAIRLAKMKNFVIHNVTVWASDNGKKWVTMPSREYEQAGKKKYFPYCRFEDQQIQEAFLKSILDAYEAQKDNFTNKAQEAPF